MKAALAVHTVSGDVEANFRAIEQMTGEAADADLVLFPEAAVTGLNNTGDPVHDLPLGQAIPGAVTERLGAQARARGIWLAIGLLERDGDRLYDSAILVDPTGKIRLKYRRIQPQWHGRNADPNVYCQGSDLGKVDTPLGSFAFLLCGDLFDDGIVDRVRELSPDWLLFPFARCFSDGSHDQERWDTEELPEYLARVKRVGTTTLMANYLAHEDLGGGRSFGGAFVVSGDGTLIDSLPLGRSGLLSVEL